MNPVENKNEELLLSPPTWPVGPGLREWRTRSIGDVSITVAMYSGIAREGVTSKHKPYVVLRTTDGEFNYLGDRRPFNGDTNFGQVLRIRWMQFGRGRWVRGRIVLLGYAPGLIPLHVYAARHFRVSP